MAGRRAVIAGGAGALVLTALGYRAWDRGALGGTTGPAYAAWEEWRGHEVDGNRRQPHQKGLQCVGVTWGRPPFMLTALSRPGYFPIRVNSRCSGGRPGSGPRSTWPAVFINSKALPSDRPEPVHPVGGCKGIRREISLTIRGRSPPGRTRTARRIEGSTASRAPPKIPPAEMPR
jgi:hypothetical protein